MKYIDFCFACWCVCLMLSCHDSTSLSEERLKKILATTWFAEGEPGELELFSNGKLHFREVPILAQSNESRVARFSGVGEWTIVAALSEEKGAWDLVLSPSNVKIAAVRLRVRVNSAEIILEDNFDPESTPVRWKINK